MFIDIHYYGVYCMARLAGIKRRQCQLIASASQFVDDNRHDIEPLRFEDGGQIDVTPTAYPKININNMDVFFNQQRLVWVPFHFLPGNEGDSLSERLICRKDSEISKQMIDYCLSNIDKDFGYYLLGIGLHVYADTFAHYGFSGVSSRWNRIYNDEIRQVGYPNWRDPVCKTMFQKLRHRFKTLFLSRIIELFTGALGHGAVLSYPDYPFLRWRFRYERHGSLSVKRDNVKTYMECLEKIYLIFCVMNNNSDFSRFRSIYETLVHIISSENYDLDDRCALWRKAAMEGKLFSEKENILPYLGNVWNYEMEDFRLEKSSSDIIHKNVYHFLRAAAVYRSYVLHDLLPEHGIILD